MTDYGEHTKWWCTRNEGYVGGGPRDLPCRHCIPVFAVIPEGERPEADEPEDGDLVVVGDDGRYLWFARPEMQWGTAVFLPEYFDRLTRPTKDVGPQI